MKRKLIRAARLVRAVLAGAVVLALACLPAVFLNSVYGYLPALFLAVLMALSLLGLFMLSRSLEVETDCADVQCERGGRIDVGLRLRSRCPLACPKAEARLVISDLFGGADEMRAVRFSIAGRGQVEFRFGMEMPHVGCFSIGLDEVVLYDFFGVFHRRTPVSGRFSAVVTPRRLPVDVLDFSEDAAAEAQTETKTSVVGGTDYTSVRAYALGDPMKQIHWKLSAHTREYMTKLQERDLQQEFTVILDFAAARCADREQLMELNDCLIETALSLLDEASTHDAGCMLLYRERSGTAVRRALSGRGDDADLLRSFSVLTPEPEPEFTDAAGLLRLETLSGSRSSHLLVVTSRVTPELLASLLRVKAQRRSPALFFVVPAQWSSREVADACTPLHQLGDAGIPYFTISTAECRAGTGAAEGA